MFSRRYASVHIVWVCVLIGAGCGSSDARCPQSTSAAVRTGSDPGGEARAAGPLASLAWLAGEWEAVDERGRVTTERWATPRGTSMMGHAETLDGSRTTHWEQLRIDLREDGSVVFVASPVGQDTTEFVAIPAVEGQQVLEVRNAEHDFPVLVRYTREGDTLSARVEGADGEGFDVRYTRVSR